MITYTTRPPRTGEEDGVAYHFISKEEFLHKLANGFFAESTEYNVASGETWYYGTGKEDLVGDKIIILNPDGLKAIRKVKGINSISFLVETDNDIRWQRLAKRGDNIDEIYRRMNADENDFCGVEDIVDIRILNNNDSVKELAKTISQKYKEIFHKRYEQEAMAYTE